MAKKPLYKRLKYGNIFVMLIIIAFVVVMVKVIKNATSGYEPSDPSSIITDSAVSVDSSQATQNPNSVLGKIDYTYVKFTQDAVNNGALVVVGSESPYKGSKPGDCISCYDYMFNEQGDKLFAIKSGEVTAKVIALEAVQKLMTDFCAIYGQASMVLMDGYDSSDASDELITGSSVTFRYLKSDGSYSDFSPIGSYQWIADNAYKYGLIMRYPENKSGETGVSGKTGYIRYVGQPHAQIMYKNNMCLEEYVEYVKKYSYENAIAYTTDNGKNYAIYYCASDGSETNVKLPTDSSGKTYKYDISGNNTDGYIITVHLPD